MKNVYAVLGMSRTGTSAIARMLQTLGVSLGDKLIPADGRNPKGFYEDADVLYRVNRGVSRAIQYQWLWIDTPETQRILSDPQIHAFEDYAVDLVRERLQKSDAWGFKDPAATTLLPFWRSVLARANVKEKYVIVMRNPLATAYSFQKFVGENLETGLILWLKHMISAVDGSEGQTRAVISYELLLESPKEQLLRMHRQLAVTQPLSEEETEQYASGFLDKSLRHHVFTADECKQHPAMQVAPLCMQIYELLMRVARDELTLEEVEFKSAWEQIKNDYQVILPTYSYIESLQVKIKDLQREIRHAHHGLSWKLMLPLRSLESRLRQYRREKKEKKRLAF